MPMPAFLLAVALAIVPSVATQTKAKVRATAVHTHGHGVQELKSAAHFQPVLAGSHHREDKAHAQKPTAPAIFSEAGYQAVVLASKRNVSQMQAYVRHALEYLGLRVVDENHFKGMLRFYDGQCTTQSYNALLQELRRGLRPHGCFKPLVEPIASPSASVLLQLSSTESKAQVNGDHDEDLPLPTWQWQSLLQDKSSDADRGLSLAQTGSEQEGPIDLLRSGYQALTGRIARHQASTLAFSAELSQAGYRKVAAYKDLESMEIFARRVLQQEGLRVTKQAAFEGMLKFYDGECATQSYKNLVRELRLASQKKASCGGPFVERIDANVTKSVNASATPDIVSSQLTDRANANN